MPMQTVAHLLKKAREAKGLSFEQIRETLKIHPRFLRALEESDYQVFSSPVHLKGFLKNYAEYLGLDVAAILAFWRREYDEAQAKKKGSFLTPLPRVLNITPGLILGGFTVFAVVGFFLYLLLAYRSVAEAPPLRVESPATDIKVATPSLLIAGQTDPEAVLTLNGERLRLDERGRFAETLRLSTGVNRLNFSVTSKLGKERRVSRTVVVEEPAPPAAAGPPPESTPTATPSR
jgi:hypothetical protein